MIQPGDTVALRAKFRDSDGNPADLDSFPLVSVIQPSGGVAIGPTSQGVMKIGVGEYQFLYSVGLFPALGVWKDVWQGTLEGFQVIGEFNFEVGTTQVPALNTDGYKHLGDDPGFNYTQIAICNINNILKSLRARLKSQGKRPTTDEYGNKIYKDCDIFTVDELVTFIARGLSLFNETPTFTYFTFEDTPIIEQFHDVFVQAAFVYSIGAQALIERGREFQIQDNGISFTPPTISDMLMNQYQKEFDNLWEKVKLIKVNMRPSPLGLGVLSFVAGASPQFRRLRTLRQRQLY
jgi:hypothetical protein